MGEHIVPITGQGWELHIQRVKEQTRGNQRRTVGVYQVFHDGNPAPARTIEDVEVPLFGTTAESKGPGQNTRPATSARPSRILAGRYPLMTSGGPEFVTTGYRSDLEVRAKMPGIELRKTGNRTAIIVHPGKNAFLSSIGCINLCTSLPDAEENIDFPGSRRRVISLIDDMKQFLGDVPEDGDAAILNAFTVIDGEPGVASPLPISAFSAGSTIDGREIAAQHDVGVKSAAVKISNLHPAMGSVIIAVAQSARELDLPRPVITSGNDSGHKQGSLHFRNRALDFRGNNVTVSQGRSLALAVLKLVGKDYDVLFEVFADKANNHLHIEFDPD